MKLRRIGVQCFWRRMRENSVNRARAVVDDIVLSDKLAYAITTGVGKLSDVRIPGDQIRELQLNLVRSHAAGVGEPLCEAETRAMMLLRANSLAKGFSGVRAVVIDRLCEILNRGVTPFVPSQGSVGASGDLAPLVRRSRDRHHRRRRGQRRKGPGCGGCATAVGAGGVAAGQRAVLGQLLVGHRLPAAVLDRHPGQGRAERGEGELRASGRRGGATPPASRAGTARGKPARPG